jgi:glycosyltransferase involved in cell wall biosynthesis
LPRPDAVRILLANAHGVDRRWGGAEKYVDELGSGLEEVGDTVQLLAAFPPCGERASAPSVTLHRTDWHDDRTRRIRNHLGDLVSRPTARLREAVAASRPDVVHTNNLPGITTAIWEACRQFRIPVVHTIHDYYLLCPRVTLQGRDGRPCCSHAVFCRARSARLARWSSAVGDVIAISDHVRLRHEPILSGARFHVVRHPIASVTAKPLRPPRAAPRTIGYLGSLSHAKGIAHLVGAARSLTELGYAVQVAGDGPLRRLVEAAASRGDLRYVGTVDGEARLRFFESTDLGVVPSTWDEPGAPPYAVAEWLAVGRPVLLTEHGGLGEVAALFPGVVAIRAGSDGIVEAGRACSEPERWRGLVTSISPPDDAARTTWTERHREIYELAVEEASGARR